MARTLKSTILSGFTMKKVASPWGLLTVEDGAVKAVENVSFEELGHGEAGNILALGKAMGKDAEAVWSDIRDAAMRLTKGRMRTEVTRDFLIIQAINCLDDLNESINIISTRLREWYGLHFPELSNKVVEHEDYAKLVLKGRREEADAPLAKDSMGIEIADADLKAIQELGDETLALYKYRQKLEKHLTKLMEDVAPNMTEIAGPLLGARLIAKASGLAHLAQFPASTIQVLGAEKALFKHLIKGTPCPKHGLILQHSSVSSAPRQKRGKVARLLATKIALASRVDYFSHKLEPSIKESWEKRLAALGVQK